MTIGELKRIIENIPDSTTIYLRTGEGSEHDTEIGSIFYQSGDKYKYREIYFVVDYANDIEVFENFVGTKCLYSTPISYMTGLPEQLKEHGIILINGNIERASEKRIKMIEAVGEEYVLALEKELGHAIQ